MVTSNISGDEEPMDETKIDKSLPRLFKFKPLILNLMELESTILTLNFMEQS